MKVFVVGEGPSDIGDLAIESQYRRGEEGFLQPVLRKLAGVPVTFDGQKLVLLPKAPKGGLEGQGRKAKQALVLAGLEGADVLVFSADLDKTGGHRADRMERRRRLRDRHSDVDEGFAAARREVAATASIKTVVCTPCRMIEAWAIAGLGAHGDPEDLWGKEEDPGSNHPKRFLQRRLNRSPRRDDFADIATDAEIADLETRCPESFKPFADEARVAMAR